MRNASRYLPASGASVCSQASRAGEENVPTVLQTLLGRERVAPGAQARGAAGPGQTSLCVAAGSERVSATSGQSVPFRPRVLHHPAL